MRSIPRNLEEFKAREAEHQRLAGESIPDGEAPVGLMLEQVMRLPVPLPYWPPPCAIGWNIYRTVAED